MKTNWLDYTLLTLVIIGAINWGLIGFFRFDLVAFLFGNLSWLSRIVYALVGIGGLYTISLYGRIKSGDEAQKKVELFCMQKGCCTKTSQRSNLLTAK